MSIYDSYNIKSLAHKLLNTQCRVMLIGDSISREYYQTSGNGDDDSFYTGMLRTWTVDWETICPDFSSGTGYVPDPAVAGDPSWPDSFSQVAQAARNNWNPDSANGVFPGNGLEAAGQSTLGSTEEILSNTFTLSELAGLPIYSLLTSENLTHGMVYQRHTSGATVYHQLAGGDVTIGEQVDTSGADDIIWRESNAGADDADFSEATLVTPSISQRAADGDQSGNYLRLAHLTLRDKDTSGLSLFPCGIPGATFEDWSNERTDTPAGDCNDAVFNDYIAGLSIDTAIAFLGTNDFGDTAAQIKTKADAMIARLVAAGVTDILLIGVYWTRAGGVSQADAEAVSQGLQDAIYANTTANVGSISLYTLNGSARIDASYVDDTTHPNEAGADLIAGQVYSELSAASTGSPMRVHHWKLQDAATWADTATTPDAVGGTTLTVETDATVEKVDTLDTYLGAAGGMDLTASDSERAFTGSSTASANPIAGRTFEITAKVEDLSATRTLFSSGDGSTNSISIRITSSGRIFVLLYVGGVDYSVQTAASIVSASDEFHLIVTIPSVVDDPTVYLDAVEIASPSISQSIPSSTGISIGSRVGASPSLEWDGIIADVAVRDGFVDSDEAVVLRDEMLEQANNPLQRNRSTDQLTYPLTYQQDYGVT